MGRVLPVLLRESGASGIAVIIFSFLANILMLTGPLFMLQIYDRVLTSGSVPTLVALAALVAVLYFLYGFLEFIRSRIMVRLAGELEHRFGEPAFNAVNYNAVQGNHNVRTVPLQDLFSIRQFLSGPGPFAFLDTPWTPIYLLIVYLMHPVLGVASVVAVSTLIVLAVINNLLVKDRNKESQKMLIKANVAGEESRRNAEVTTALGMLDRVRGRWRAIQEQALSEYLVSSDRSGALSALSRTMRLFFQSAILGLGAWLAIAQEISPGTMIAASIIMTRALAPVEQLVVHWQGYVGFKLAWSRLAAVVSNLPKSSDNVALPDPKGELLVQGLDVRIPGSSKPQLNNISFHLEKGEGLGIIGPTGSGKTTLARVLVGVLPHYRGTVRLDGAELIQYQPEQLGKCVGYLPQSVELFDGTIGENISRFDPNPEPGAIIRAAKQADIHNLILRFPDGYNTSIGEGGAALSAGQRQRIGLARALYGEPSLIVLDEPNANLDAEGEQAVVDAVKKSCEEGKTVIVVAHRPSALAAVSKVMMLQDGKCVAFGPVNEVLNKVLNKGAHSNTSGFGYGTPMSIVSNLDRGA